MVEKDNALMLIYYRVFYCLFVGLKRSMKEDDGTIAFVSALMFSFMQYWNVFTISLFITVITESKIYRYPWHWSLLLFAIINWLLLIRRKKYLQIKNMFDRETKKQKNRRRLLCVAYIVITWVAFPVAMYLVGSKGLYGYAPQ